MRFTDSHEWVRMSGQTATVGITTHAQKELGDIVFVELPQVGRKVKAGEEIAVLESTKSAADIYAPLSGVIAAVNEEVRRRPSLINEHPEQGGWLFKMDASHPEEFSRLLSASDYQRLV